MNVPAQKTTGAANMYEVRSTGEKFENFMKAVAAAREADSEVVEITSGIIRWSPAPKVTAKRMRQYREQKAAYEAQEASKK